MEHTRDPMRNSAHEGPEQENPEGKSMRKPPGFAVTAQPPPPPGGKDGKPTQLPAQEHATAPADATQAHVRGPIEIHPEVETEGVTITADNVAPADRKAWKYLGQEGITYYYFCEWKGVPYFVTATSINSGEDIYHYAEACAEPGRSAQPDAVWKLFYPDAPPDFMGDLQRTVALHYDLLEWTKIIVMETAVFLLMEQVSLAGHAARVGIAWWRAGRTIGRQAGKAAGRQVGKKAAKEAAETVAEGVSAEAAEQTATQTAKAVAKKQMRAFTKANARHNLQVVTGEEGVGMHAHHIFPQAKEFQPYFEKVGINIHHPHNLRWWPKASHQKVAKEYNDAWRTYLFTENPETRLEIERFGQELMTLYGF